MPGKIAPKVISITQNNIWSVCNRQYTSLSPLIDRSIYDCKFTQKSNIYTKLIKPRAKYFLSEADLVRFRRKQTATELKTDLILRLQAIGNRN